MVLIISSKALSINAVFNTPKTPPNKRLIIPKAAALRILSIIKPISFTARTITIKVTAKEIIGRKEDSIAKCSFKYG